MSPTKRPSTSSLRRFVSSRPYVPVAELRRRFGLEEPDDMVRISRNGTSAFIGVPAREAAKLEELWTRDELGVELSVDVRAPVVVGVSRCTLPAISPIRTAPRARAERE